MFEVYAYHNSDSLFGIFNAIAAIVGSGSYMSATAAVAFCGFVAAFLAYAFAPEKLQGWKWLGTVVLVYSILFVPRVNVGIVDKTGGAPVKVVANVPLGLAVFGGLTSSIGNTLTELFETAFQTIPGAGSLPSELTYLRNGLLFGNRLVRETRNLVFDDPNFRTDLINFIYNCTMYDLIDGAIDPTAFSRSDDVWSMMSSPNPARFTTITGTGAMTVMTCPEAYLNLNGRLPVQVSLLQGRLALQLNPTLSSTVAAGVIAGQVQQAYIKNNIANASATAADIIRQNAVLNTINDTSQIIGQKTNDPASMVLAVGRAQAVAQTNASWINYGKVAEQALPIVRNVVEAMTYALFPLVILLLFLTSGRETMLALKAYGAVLIWVQLWPILYAILNYMGSIYAAAELSAAAEIGAGVKALSLRTASSIYSNAISTQAVVGYLVISIPFIAWAAVKRMETFGTAVVGGLSGLQGAISGSTAAAATGNVGMGNVSMDQTQLAPNRSSAFMNTWQDDLSGNTMTSNILNGRSAVSLLRNQGFASRVVSVKVSEHDVIEASRSADSARSEAIAANNERSAVLADVFSKGIGNVQSNKSSTGSTTSSFEEIGTSLDRLNQATSQIAARTGVTQTQVAQIAFAAAARFGLEGGAGMPSWSPIGGRASLGTEESAKAGKAYSAGLTSDEQKVLQHLSSEQLAEFKRFGDRISRDSGFVASLASDTRTASEMSSRLAMATSRTERAEAAYAERLALAERLSSARERGETISIDIAQDPHNLEMFTRYAEQYGGTSAAAFALLEAELARQGLRPNRVFSSGSALPLTFDNIRENFLGNSADRKLNPDFAARDSTNDASVAGAPLQVTGLQGLPAPYPGPLDGARPSASLRSQVQGRGGELKSETNGAQADFERRAQVTTGEDGVLASRKSLVKQVSQQVGRDAAETVSNAKDLVKDLVRNSK